MLNLQKINEIIQKEYEHLIEYSKNGKYEHTNNNIKLEYTMPETLKNFSTFYKPNNFDVTDFPENKIYFTFSHNIEHLLNYKKIKHEKVDNLYNINLSDLEEGLLNKVDMTDINESIIGHLPIKFNHVLWYICYVKWFNMYDYLSSLKYNLKDMYSPVLVFNSNDNISKLLVYDITLEMFKYSPYTNYPNLFKNIIEKLSNNNIGLEFDNSNKLYNFHNVLNQPSADDYDFSTMTILIKRSLIC